MFMAQERRRACATVWQGEWEEDKELRRADEGVLRHIFKARRRGSEQLEHGLCRRRRACCVCKRFAYRLCHMRRAWRVRRVQVRVETRRRCLRGTRLTPDARSHTPAHSRCRCAVYRLTTRRALSRL
jgi:hypothetical protein